MYLGSVWRKERNKEEKNMKIENYEKEMIIIILIWKKKYLREIWEIEIVLLWGKE